MSRPEGRSARGGGRERAALEPVLRAPGAPADDAGVAGQRGAVRESRRPDCPVAAVHPPCAEFPPQPVLAGHARALKAGELEAGETVLGEVAMTSYGDASVLEGEVEDPGVADDREIDEEALEPF